MVQISWRPSNCFSDLIKIFWYCVNPLTRGPLVHVECRDVYTTATRITPTTRHTETKYERECVCRVYWEHAERLVWVLFAHREHPPQDVDGQRAEQAVLAEARVQAHGDR